MAKKGMDFDISLNEMSIPEAHDLALKVPMPVMYWGAPGIGKSQGLEALAKDKGMDLYVWSAGVAEPTDVGGIPFQTDQGYADYLVTKFFWYCTEHPDVPEDKRGPAILFLDDLVTAPEQVQNACYHLLDASRQVGNERLRDNVKVICAGNRIDDGAGVTDMGTALASRLFHIYVKPDAPSWVDWAVDANIYPRIVGFIEKNKGHITNFGPETRRSSEHAFACPRTWEFLSNAMWTLEQAGMVNSGGGVPKGQKDYRFKVASGCIGQSMAANFLAFVDTTANIVSPEDILKNPKKAPTYGEKRPDLVWATVANIRHFCRNTDIPKGKLWDPFGTYCLRVANEIPEIGIILAKDIVNTVINELDDSDRRKAASSQLFVDMFELLGDHLSEV